MRPIHSTHLLDLQVKRRECVEAFCDFGSFPRFSVGTLSWPLQRPRSRIGTRFHDAGVSRLACLCVPARRQAPTLEPGSQRVLFRGDTSGSEDLFGSLPDAWM